MRNLFCILFFAFSLTLTRVAGAQAGHSFDEGGSIIDNYLKALNFDQINPDSMLYIETSIVNQSYTADTQIMKRWFVMPFNYRTELWHGDTLLHGVITNGANVHKEYKFDKKQWADVDVTHYMDVAAAYDFHGPFFRWRYMGLEVKLEGTYKLEGHDVYKVFVASPDRYDRNYLFEKETGLLFLIEELDSHRPEMVTNGRPHVNWRGCHEYFPLGNCLFPSVESYMEGGTVTVLNHSIRYLPKKMELFEK